MRLRQTVLAAPDLEPAVEALRAVLGIEVGFRDPGVAAFGLVNAVLPVGDTFLEVVSPTRPDAAAQRFLERRGAGGYMVIFQTDDPEAVRRRAADLGVREVWHGAFPATADEPEIEGTHFHPADIGGAIVSVDRARPAPSWRWAGPAWTAAVRTERVTAIVAVELQAADPHALASRWSAVLGEPPVDGPQGPELRLDASSVRFVPASDGRGDGLGGFDVACRDVPATLAAARARGLEVTGDRIDLCGARVALVPADR
ncbi:MAG: VOC family protein [Acidimicrobiales bacterium]|nr:VOC family protein [Acidimicrobiales bacterium]